MTIPSHLQPICRPEAIEAPLARVRCPSWRWVLPCAAGLGLGLIWGCWRARRDPAPATPQQLTPAQRRALVQALALLAQLRRGDSATPAAVGVQAVPTILEVVAVLRSTVAQARTASQEPCAPALPHPLGARRAAISHHLLDPAEAGSVRHLASLAARLAPLGEDTVSVIEHELCVGEIAAISHAREAAITRLFEFCVGHSLEIPDGVIHRMRAATVVPHDAPGLPPAGLYSVAEGWARTQVLVYRPDALPRWGGASAPDLLDAGRAFDAILGPGSGRGRTDLASPAAVKARALLRVMLHKALARGIHQFWVSPPWIWKACRLVAPGPTVTEQLMARLEAVWPEPPVRDELAAELVGACARLLTDLVWGGPVSRGYHDAFGLTQLMSCAVADLPDPRTALAAWFNRDPDAFAELGRALLERADRMHQSMQAGTQV